MSKARLGPVREALVVSAVVTALVTLVALPSRFIPTSFVATTVCFIFLFATWIFVWRRTDEYVEHCGLSLGGLVMPGPLDLRRLARGAGSSILWAAAFAVLTFVPFFFGWRLFWHPRGAFELHVQIGDLLSDAFGQLLIVALPEEAFYRGYLQTRLNDGLALRVRLFGASVGPSLLLTSAIFAVGHFATIHDPARLAVFFPSLAFGWLRARTGGIGAGMVFHASCNIFSQVLGHGYGVY